MSDALDALFPTTEPEAPAPVVETVTEAPVEAVTPEPVVQAPESEVKPEPVPQQEHSVPLAKYLDTRDELKELKRWKAEQEAAKPQVQHPDPLDDPDGFRASIRSEFEAELSQQRFQMSDVMARQVHGAEAVEQAVTWAQEKAQADPMFAASYMRDPNPIDWIVRQHKRDGLLSELGDDPVAYARKIAEREGWLSAPAAVVEPQVLAAVTQQAPKPAVPPPSLVTAPSAGGTTHMATGLNAGLEAVFPR